MARDKKSMIGFDPLAWLADDADESAEVEKVSDEKLDAQPQKGSEKMKTDIITVLGHSIDETALLKGYKLAEDVLDEAAINFYDELFTQHPGVKPLFKNTNDKTQAGKLGAAIKLLVDNLHNEEALRTTLTTMGEQHQRYGALPEHYPIVAELLVASFKKSVGRSWTKAVSAAWMELLVAAAETMCAAYTDEVIEDVAEEVIEDIEIPSFDGGIASDHPVLHLSSIQDISKSQALKNDMLTLVNDNDVIDIDASDVERIDGSAMQLLCALFNYAQQNSLVIHWLEPSDALTQAAETLGVKKILQLK